MAVAGAVNRRQADVIADLVTSTIANVRKEDGIRPAPSRPSSWRSFLKAHWGEIAATDFFATEVWTLTGLRTYYMLFMIDLKSRRVHMAGMATNPNAAFMVQIARNLTDAADGYLRDHGSQASRSRRA